MHVLQLMPKFGRFFLLLMCVGAAAFAGDKGKIAGNVTDSQTGEPLVGANVEIEGLQTGASTDADGDFFIINIHPGTYTVTCSYIGYKIITYTDILVKAGRTTRMQIKLAPAVIEGQTVTVTADRPIIEKDVTASEQVIGTELLERSWARTVSEALETQTGIFSTVPDAAWERGRNQTLIRGSSSVQALYQLDNLSVNSGLMSDNYTGFNTSTIQEISVLTGGYNAEYGDARTAIINVVSKESAEGVKGTLLSRFRPAGKYHFGPNFYSTSNYDYQHFDLEYWTAESQNNNSEFFGENPEELLSRWRQQITPNDTLGNYADRPEYELEGTLFGGLNEQLSFLASARYKHGVGIFPQAIPYNPEFNFQGYLNYNISTSLKLRIGGFFGGWESSDYRSANMNTLESAQQALWSAPMRIDEQYARAKYNPYGAIYRHWPEQRRWTQVYGRFTHILNANAFYEFTLSYLRDKMDRSDRNNMLPDTLFSTRDDELMMIDRFLQQGYNQTWDKNSSKVYAMQGDYTNQITKNHLMKAGVGFRYYDFHFEHFNGLYEGGSRRNFVNIFDGTPYEGHLYLQDKIEYSGLVLNLGVRADFFDQNRDAPKNMFDPLAIQPTTPGHDPDQPLGIPGNPEREATDLQVAVAPRLGVAHPISQNAVLHFSYGHFYQRPSWTKMFGMPFVNFTEDMSTALDPYANQITYMEEWQGWYGNPKLGFERTIQAELGIDYNFSRWFKLDFTGYYKDSNREAGVITGVYGAIYDNTKPLMLSNSGYSDVRGIETRLDTHFPQPFNVGVSHDIYWSFAGETGFSRLFEEGSTRLDVPKGLRENKGDWSSYHRVKAWGNLYLEPGSGPEFFGTKPLGDLNIFAYFWWRSGHPYTYHPPGDISTRANNRRWFNYYQLNLKLSKGFDWYGIRAELSADIRNVFDWQFYSLLYGDDMTRWQENPALSEEDRLPRNWFSGEPDVWGWYTYEVPPRQIYMQLKLDF
ncbi:MAG: TonB-dependent receptor [Calditrichaeota bacterium]|nr:TonB-dependent receptor [Calditrichota bacterium]